MSEDKKPMIVTGQCTECGETEKIDVGTMWKVTGQDNGEREEAIIAECMTCGWKWRVVE